MNILKIAFGLLIFLTLYSCGTKLSKTNRMFHGMWRFDKFEIFDSLTNTWTDDRKRIGGNGYIIYDGQGHMGVQLTPKGYKDFDTNKNIDSLTHEDLVKLINFYKSNFVYFSNYLITDSTVEHKVLSATEPKSWGVPVKRNLEFKRDTLILTLPQINGVQNRRLRWVKLK